MAALIVGGKIDGLYGLSYAMLAVQSVQSLITAPTVLRTAFEKVTVRQGGNTVGSDEARSRFAERAEEIRLRQEAGVAALISLATKVAPYRPLTRVDVLGPDSPTWSKSTQPQQEVTSQGRHRRSTTVPATKANPMVVDTNWWPDIDEATFQSRQAVSMAVLISLARHAAKL
jgi:hypothetical protein